MTYEQELKEALVTAKSIIWELEEMRKIAAIRNDYKLPNGKMASSSTPFCLNAMDKIDNILSKTLHSPQDIISSLEETYKKADAINDIYGYMWDECLRQMEQLQADMKGTLDTYEDSQPHEDHYAMHNTMSHFHQGTKP